MNEIICWIVGLIRLLEICLDGYWMQLLECA